MATEKHAQTVENIINYKFKSKRNLLFQALTAAGAVTAEWDGNRKLAQFGTALTEFLFVYLGYELQADRNHTTDFKCQRTNNKQHATVAERTGIDKCIMYSKRQTAITPSVLAKAMNAIIGAVFLDCEGSILTVLGVMERLGLFAKQDQTVDPMMLSLHAESNFDDVTSFARAILGNGIERTSLPDAGEHSHPTIASSSVSSVEFSAEVAPTVTIRIAGHRPDQLNLPLDDEIPREGLGLDYWVGISSPSASIENLNNDQEANHRPALKRKAPDPHKTARKKILDKHSRNNSLAVYLSEEAEKCAEHGCQLPEETFFTPEVRATIHDLCEAKVDILAKIVVYIASSHSIAALHEVLHKSKTEENIIALQPETSISKADRFNIIQRLDQSMIHLQLLRRHHVVELFRENGGPETRLSSRFVMATPQSLDMPQNRSGNPLNSAEAEVTSKIMVEIFPTIQRDSDEYTAKYRIVTNLRKLGQRLHLLVETFGKGILGLMLDRGITGEPNFGISDRMIMKLPDAVFRDFITLLDQFQGKILREFSAAVTPMVDTLVFGPSRHQVSFRLESVQFSEILRLPKGSKRLLDLIT